MPKNIEAKERILGKKLSNINTYSTNIVYFIALEIEILRNKKDLLISFVDG